MGARRDPASEHRQPSPETCHVATRTYCGNCNATLREDDTNACPLCGSRKRAVTLQVPTARLTARAVPPDAISVVTVDGLAIGSTREERLEARLRALVAAAEQTAEEMDDDGKFAIVPSERLQRLLGVASRDREDLEAGPGGRL